MSKRSADSTIDFIANKARRTELLKRRATIDAELEELEELEEEKELEKSILQAHCVRKLVADKIDMDVLKRALLSVYLRIYNTPVERTPAMAIRYGRDISNAFSRMVLHKKDSVAMKASLVDDTFLKYDSESSSEWNKLTFRTCGVIKHKVGALIAATSLESTPFTSQSEFEDEVRDQVFEALVKILKSPFTIKSTVDCACRNNCEVFF